MISYEQFQKMQELKSIGLSMKKTRAQLRVSYYEVAKWWHCSEREFLECERTQEFQMDNYREFIVSLLRTCPQIRETNIEYKLRENFPDFSVKRSTFYRYMRNLREQTGYISPYSKRNTSIRPDLPPAYEAQVDFGQYKLRSMYGKEVRVYFFVMVLSYSRMKFLYFQPRPFTTSDAIEAHRYAFSYFHGRTQTILYDQDRVFVVSENLGNILFVSEFEEFVKETGFSVVLCRPRDPQSKGKVEDAVAYIKMNFLEGREYTGIDSLNSAALEWLDREGNGSVNHAIKKTPRELFREEVKFLTKVSISKRKVNCVYTVTKNNYIEYKDNRYEIPQDAMLVGCRVRTEEQDGMLLIYRSTSNELVCKHPLSDAVGTTVSLENGQTDYLSLRRAESIFSYSEEMLQIIAETKKGNPRYIDAQLKWLNRLRRYYSEAEIATGAAYCVRTKRLKVPDLMVYLLYRYGDEKGKKCLALKSFGHYKEKALRIKEELDGRY